MATNTTTPVTTTAADTAQTSGSPLDAITSKAGPLVGQARQFAKDRPFTAAAVAGVVGLAILNTLRGK